MNELKCQLSDPLKQIKFANLCSILFPNSAVIYESCLSNLLENYLKSETLSYTSFVSPPPDFIEDSCEFSLENFGMSSTEF